MTAEEKKFIWQAEVRDYEVDYQGIVNNACYFNYLATARAKLLIDIGINIRELASKKINLVLFKTSMSYLKSLSFGDSFVVESTLNKMSKLKFVCDQQIFRDKQLILEAQSIICCVDAKSGKPYFLETLESLKAF